MLVGDSTAAGWVGGGSSRDHGNGQASSSRLFEASIKSTVKKRKAEPVPRRPRKDGVPLSQMNKSEWPENLQQREVKPLKKQPQMDMLDWSESSLRKLLTSTTASKDQKSRSHQILLFKHTYNPPRRLPLPDYSKLDPHGILHVEHYQAPVLAPHAKTLNALQEGRPHTPKSNKRAVKRVESLVIKMVPDPVETAAARVSEGAGEGKRSKRASRNAQPKYADVADLDAPFELSQRVEPSYKPLTPTKGGKAASAREEEEEDRNWSAYREDLTEHRYLDNELYTDDEEEGWIWDRKKWPFPEELKQPRKTKNGGERIMERVRPDNLEFEEDLIREFDSVHLDCHHPIPYGKIRTALPSAWDSSHWAPTPPKVPVPPPKGPTTLDKDRLAKWKKEMQKNALIDQKVTAFLNSRVPVKLPPPD